MSSAFEAVSLVFSVVLGAVALASTVYALRADAAAARESAKQLDSMHLSEALERRDLAVIRQYLLIDLRNVRVVDYVADASVRKQFDDMVSALATFVAKDR